MNHNLPDIEFFLIREMITSRMGLNFPIEGWSILKHRLASAATEFGYQDMQSFIQWLLSSKLNRDQIRILASHLTISETYFWRESKVFDALTDNILPEVIRAKKNGDKSIRIWSAGCSTGEEPYSIAIALHKVIPEITDWNISILATDINPKAIDKAETGIYTPWSFRNTPVWLKAIYFHHLNDRKYEIIPEIKKMVTFSCFNLTHKDFLSTICKNHKIDIIFCRNVLMYLSKEWAARVSQNLYNSLSDEGWLIVSSCELSSDRFPQFIPANFPGAILYRKGKEENSGTNNHLPEAHSKLFFNTLPSLLPEREVMKHLLFSSDTCDSELIKEDNNITENYIQPDTARKDALVPQSRLMTREDILNETKTAIRLLASQGHPEKALSICNEAIETYKLDRSLYFLRASILQELVKNNEAIKSLKQAIFIDPDYIIGHFLLGNLFNRQGNVKNAKRHYLNALHLLDTISNEEIPPESDGFSAKYIREIILGNLSTQKAV